MHPVPSRHSPLLELLSLVKFRICPPPQGRGLFLCLKTKRAAPVFPAHSISPPAFGGACIFPALGSARAAGDPASRRLFLARRADALRDQYRGKRRPCSRAEKAMPPILPVLLHLDHWQFLVAGIVKLFAAVRLPCRCTGARGRVVPAVHRLPRQCRQCRRILLRQYFLHQLLDIRVQFGPGAGYAAGCAAVQPV